MNKKVMRPLTEAEMQVINGGSIWTWLGQAFTDAFNWVKSHFVKSSWNDGSWEAGCKGHSCNVKGGGISFGL